MIRALLKFFAFTMLIASTICLVLDRVHSFQNNTPLIGDLDQYGFTFPNLVVNYDLDKLPIWSLLFVLAILLFLISWRRKGKFYKPFY